MIETQNIKVAKTFLFVLLTFIGLSLFSQAQAATPTDVRVSVEGKALELATPPIIVDGRTLVAVRAVGEAVGGTVEWNQAQQQATVRRRNDVVILTLGRKEALVNGKIVTMDVPAQLVSNRTMVPLRFIAEALGGSVEWNPATRTANILRKPAFIVSMRYSKDVGTATLVLGLSEPPSSLNQVVLDNRLSVEMYPAVIGLETPSLSPYDSLAQQFSLQFEGRTVRLQAHLWNPPVLTSKLSDDGTELRLEFSYGVTGIHFQGDGRISTAMISSTGRLNYNAFLLKDPARLVVDIAGAHLGQHVPTLMDVKNPLVNRIRSAVFSRNPDAVRIVFDLAKEHPAEVISTDLGLQIQFIPEISAIRTQKLQGKTRLTFATSLPVDAKVVAMAAEKVLQISIPQVRSTLAQNQIRLSDGTIDTVTVSPGPTANSSEITVRLPYYLGHEVISQPGEANVVIDLITSPVYGKRIWVDAGHGADPSGYDDPGTKGTATKVTEKAINLLVATELKQKLEAAGATVFMSRTGNVGIKFEDRPRAANAVNPPIDLFVSIHHNSTANAQVRGTETYYWTTNAKSRAAAESIHAAVVGALRFPDRGVRRFEYFVIKQTVAPSVLLELGYMTNLAEERAIVEPGVQKKTYPGKAAEGIKNGIFDYFRQESGASSTK